jgi:hypothetical protein
MQVFPETQRLVLRRFTAADQRVVAGWKHQQGSGQPASNPQGGHAGDQPR